MSHKAVAHSRLVFAVMLVTGFAQACSDAPNEPNLEPTLVVVTKTTGLATDTDGYTIRVARVTSVSHSAVAANDTIAVVEPSGDYMITLRGVSGNCAAVEPDQRFVSLSSHTTDTVQFRATCWVVNADSGFVGITGQIRATSPQAVIPSKITLDDSLSYVATGVGTFHFGDVTDGNHLLTIQNGAGLSSCHLSFDPNVVTAYSESEYDGPTTQNVIVTMSNGAPVVVYFVYDCAYME